MTWPVRLGEAFSKEGGTIYRDSAEECQIGANDEKMGEVYLLACELPRFVERI